MPTVADEDRRQPHRELIALKDQTTEHSNRIKGLLASFCIDVIVDEHFVKSLSELRQWDDAPMPPELTARLLREFALWRLVDEQVRELEAAQRRAIHRDDTVDVDKVRMLLELRAIGPRSATLFVREFFGWRQIQNRRELASLASLSPTPYHSGDSQREQGISKAGNRRLRWMAVEIAWAWLRWQPDSVLSQWYQRRFGQGNARARKIGIVAPARRLLVALWKYLEHGEVPEGAKFTPWKKKLNGRLPAGMIMK